MAIFLFKRFWFSIGKVEKRLNWIIGITGFKASGEGKLYLMQKFF
jgi:uncharacterized membrane protein YphA (DoxX/SURF4 family)